MSVCEREKARERERERDRKRESEREREREREEDRTCAKTSTKTALLPPGSSTWLLGSGFTILISGLDGSGAVHAFNLEKEFWWARLRRFPKIGTSWI